MSMNPDNPTGSSSLGSSTPDTPPSENLSSGGGTSSMGTSAATGASPFPTGADRELSKPKASGADLLNRVVQGAHQTIDRLAETAAPHVDRLEHGMGSAGEGLHQRADEWTDGLRTTVREHPLAAVGAALALGVLVARLAR
jgi:ElaB/YqjD/DUF883 family membrane-anchored ribosome-binding protein